MGPRAATRGRHAAGEAGPPGFGGDSLSVDPDEYGYFLSKVWDEWLARDYGKALVSFCETLVVQHMGMPAQTCINSELCGKGVALEHEGSVYACDHYVYPEYRLGNVREESLGDMVFSPTQVRFAYAKSETLPEYCKRCAFLAIAGASARRTGCCARRTARRGSIIFARVSSGSSRTRCRPRRSWRHNCARNR